MNRLLVHYGCDVKLTVILVIWNEVKMNDFNGYALDDVHVHLNKHLNI